jgi:CRP/FNR family transcriptional regulator, anaerobic regulatory protein
MTGAADWTAGLSLSPKIKQSFKALPQQILPAKISLFHAGAQAQGFVIVLSGRIEVTLTAASGREILLYAIEPGQSCIQTTLGLMGDEAYTGAA